MTNFPTIKDTNGANGTLPVEPSGTPLATSHIAAHQNAADAIIALETKIGVDASADTSTLDYKVKSTSSLNPGHKHSMAAGMSDVNVTPNDGDVLVYNAGQGKWINNTTSAPDASTTVKGISKLSLAPVLATAPISVGDNDTRIPTQGENDALAGTSGTSPSGSNKFVDNADTRMLPFSIASPAQGSVMYFNGTNWVKLAPGISGNFFQTQGASANPQWAYPAQGWITSTPNLYTDVSSTLINWGTTPTKVHELQIQTNAPTMTYTVQGTIKNYNGQTCSYQIYKNGVPYGTLHSTTSTTDVVFTDSLNFTSGDTIQLYAYVSGAGTGGYVDGFVIIGIPIPAVLIPTKNS